MNVKLRKNYFTIYAKMSYDVIFSQCIVGEVYWKSSQWHWIGCGKKGNHKIREKSVQELLKAFEETYVR